MPRPRSSFPFVLTTGPQNQPESLANSELDFKTRAVSGKHTYSVKQIQEIKGTAGLWEKRGDGDNVPAGVGGRKMTLGTQTNRSHSRAEHRNQEEIDSENNERQE